MTKNYIAGFILTLMYLLTNFCMKYCGTLFNDFWDIDQLTNKIILGDITVTAGFIVSILVGVVFGFIYDLIGFKSWLDPIFENSFLYDSD
tara:strand:- start:679 stop:948 length:270 start_codon:yes stop_codon:yes gene_type:complete